MTPLMSPEPPLFIKRMLTCSGQNAIFLISGSTLALMWAELDNLPPHEDGEAGFVSFDHTSTIRLRLELPLLPMPKHQPPSGKCGAMDTPSQHCNSGQDNYISSREAPYPAGVLEGRQVL